MQSLGRKLQNNWTSKTNTHFDEQFCSTAKDFQQCIPPESMCSVVLAMDVSWEKRSETQRMTDAQIEKCHQPFCSCIHKHGYQFTLLWGLRLSRKTRVAAASHGSGATRAPRPLGFSCLLALAIDFWTFGPRLQTGVERAWTSPSDPGHNTAVRFPTLTCVVVYTQVSGAGGRRTVSSAGFSGLQWVFVGYRSFLGWVMAQLDPDVLQATLLQVAEATQAASKAAQAAAQSASQAASSPSAAAGQQRAAIDWSKLVNKPPVFGENATADDDIRLFRDWLWQLTQFLVTIDSEYESEVKQVTDDPTKPLDLSSASTDTRGRAAKLYGLMSSLVRCRALAIVKAVPSGNGYEALRQLVLAMRPNTQSRGLAMLASLTSWGAF